jgi:hypothetical protein
MALVMRGSGVRIPASAPCVPSGDFGPRFAFSGGPMGREAHWRHADSHKPPETGRRADGQRPHSVARVLVDRVPWTIVERHTKRLEVVVERRELLLLVKPAVA